MRHSIFPPPFPSVSSLLSPLLRYGSLRSAGHVPHHHPFLLFSHLLRGETARTKDRSPITWKREEVGIRPHGSPIHSGRDGESVKEEEEEAQAMCEQVEACSLVIMVCFTLIMGMEAISDHASPHPGAQRELVAEQLLRLRRNEKREESHATRGERSAGRKKKTVLAPSRVSAS